MSTVGELIDRVLRDWLEPPDGGPVVTVQVGAFAAGATTISFNETYLTTEERDSMATGTLLEVGQELLQITDDAGRQSGFVVVRRGVLGTTDATHSAGDEIRVAPEFPRKQVFDAMADVIEGLYPDLAARKTAAMTWTPSWVDGPADLGRAVKFVWNTTGGKARQAAEVQVIKDFPDATNDIAVILTGVPTSTAGYIVYDAEFTRPTAESDDAQATVGLDTAWEELVVVGTAARLIASRSLDATRQDFITQQLELQNVQVGQTDRLRDALLRYFRFLVDSSRAKQRAGRQPVVTYNAAW